MPLGYKYAERDATSYVDWGEIGKNLSDMLTNENKLREQKKDALDAEQRATQKLLSEPPQGIDESMNEYTLKYTSDLQQASLLNYKLLKSGRLKPKDFTIKNQNLTDNTKTLFNLSKEYQEQYKSAMDDYLSGDPDRELQDLTPFLMAHVEGYANFTNTKPIINEKDYTVTLAKMKFNEEKGVMEMSKDPNDFLSVSTLSNMIKQKYKKYNVQKNVGAYVDGLGEQLDTIAELGEIHKFGTITEIFDQTNIKNLPKDDQGIIMDFEKAETKMLTALLPTPFDYTSVLTNSIKIAPNKEIYTYTWNPDEAKKNENLILLKKDPQTKGIVPDLTQKQKDAAVEHLRLQARVMYDNKKKVTVAPQKERNEPTYRPPGPKPTPEENDAVNFGTNLGYLTTGTAAQQQVAVDYFKAIPGISSVIRDDEKVVITTDDGETLEYKFGENNPRDYAGSIVKALNKEKLDENIILTNARKVLGSSITSGSATGVKVAAPTETKDKNFYTKKFAALTRQITNNRNYPSGVFHQEQDVVVEELTPILAPLGITVKASGTMGDYVTFSAPGKQSIEIGADAFKKSKAQAFERKLLDWLSKNFPNEESLKSAFGASTGELD